MSTARGPAGRRVKAGRVRRGRAVAVLVVAALLAGGVAPLPAAPSPGGFGWWERLSQAVAALVSPAPTRAEAALAGAARPARVELPKLRTERSRTFQRPDGRLETVVSAGPVNYRDARGAWQPIDDTLVGAGTPGYGWRNRADRYTVLLPANLADGPVRVQQGKAWLSFRLEGAAVTAHGQAGGNAVTYREALPGVTVGLAAVRDGVKESLVLAGPAAPSSYRFQVRTSPGLSVKPNRSGGLDVYQGKVFRFGLPAPFMTDASGALSRAVRFTTTPAPGGRSLTVAADPAWLASPERRWPVTIDPTVTLVGPAVNADCHIAGGSLANQGFCSSTELEVGSASGGAHRHGLLFFSVASVPHDAQVLSATLSLFVPRAGVNGGLTVGLRQLFTGFTSGATWNLSDGVHPWGTPGGDYAGIAVSTVRAGDGAGTVSLGAQPLVQGWVSGQIPNKGFLLRRQVEDSNTFLVRFISRNNTDSAHWPKLTIVYSRAPVAVDKRSMTPGDSADAGTTTPTLHGGFADPDGDRGHVDYEVADPATGAVVASGAGTTVASGSDSAFAVPSGVLAANTTYRWRARGNDGSTVGPWSAYKYFNTQAASILGVQRRFGFEGRPLNDRSELRVNVANGNLLLAATDLRIHGTGLDLVLDRYYNSRQPAVTALGKGWTLGVGQDVRLIFASANHAASDVTYVAPSGFGGRFNWDSTENRWRHPPGVDADLTRNATTGEWTLKFQKTEAKSVFSDVTGRLLREVDRNGNTISFDYNAQGLLSTVTDTQDRQATLSYVGGRLDTVTDPAGRIVHYTYTADGNLETVTDPAGAVMRYRYNGDLLIDQITTGGNSLTRVDYTSPGGKVADFSTQYESGFGVPTSATTSFTYATGETKVTDPTGNFTTTDLTDGITTYRFDDRDRITKVIDALGHTQDKTYTSTDNIARITDALQKQTTLTWDPNDENLTTTTLATGTNSQLQYGSTAHPHAVTAATDPQGNTLLMTYDAAGNLDTTRSSADPAVNLEDRDYNDDGTISKITDGNGNVTSFGYDAKGNLTSVDSPAPLGDITLTPDSLSRLQTMVDGKNQTTTYTYDPVDRPDVATYQDGSTIDTNYDLDGNLVQTTDATGITVLAYDKMNRQIRKTLPDNTQLRYDYDHNGNLSSYTDPGGQVTYTYNQANLLTELLEPGASTPVRFAYNHNNRPITTTYPTTPTPTVMTAGYDDAGKLTSIKATVGTTTLSSFTYSYTKGGADTALRQSMTDLSGTTSYAYDDLNRLTGATGPGLSRSYVYDDNSNRTSKTENGTTTSYGYNPANELTTVNDTPTYTYDGNGNLTGGAGWSLVYNATNQTNSITKPGGTALTPLTYEGADQTQRTQAGTTGFINSALGVASATTGSGSDFYTRDSRGTLVSLRTASGSRFYYLFDGLGSVVGLVNSTGSKVNTYSYDPYGKQLSATEAVPNPWRYASGQFDTQTGLTKFGTRYYDPDLGRFTQRDPSGQDLPYAYAGANPVNGIDPSGLITFGVCLQVSEGFIIGILAQGCAVWSPSDGFGATASYGFGIQSPTVSVAAQLQVSNANDIAELAGPFEDVGATALGASGDVFWGTSCGREISGVEIGVGGGIPPVEGHYYATDTATSHDADFSCTTTRMM